MRKLLLAQQAAPQEDEPKQKLDLAEQLAWRHEAALLKSRGPLAKSGRRMSTPGGFAAIILPSVRAGLACSEKPITCLMFVALSIAKSAGASENLPRRPLWVYLWRNLTCR
jgi:hypothetical protein